MKSYIITLLTLGPILIAGGTVMAQNEAASRKIERQVAGLLDKAEYLTDKYQYDRIRTDTVRSVENALMATLLKGLNDAPGSISYPFIDLRKRRLRIATSKDGQLRIYSWDVRDQSDMGATSSIVQYKTPQGTRCRIFFDAQNDASDDPGAFYTRIYTLKSGGKLFYLAFGHSQYNHWNTSQRMRALAIAGDKLVDTLKLFKQEGQLANVFEIYYDYFDYLKHGRPEMHFDPARNFLFVPVTRGDKVILPRYRKYFFDKSIFKSSL